MSVVRYEELKNFLKTENCGCYSRDLYLVDKLGIKIETELKISLYRDTTDIVEITTFARENYWREIEDGFSKRIYYSLGDIILDESLDEIIFEKVVESVFVKFEAKSTKEILEHPDVKDHIRINVKADLSPRILETKTNGFIFGLMRDKEIIKMVWIAEEPGVEEFRRLFKLSKLPIVDNPKFQDDRYIVQMLEYLKDNIDIDVNDSAHGVDLGIRTDTSLIQLEKMGIFGITIPDVKLFLIRSHRISS